MNNFWQRALTGLFFVILVCLMVIWKQESFWILICLIAGISTHEYVKSTIKEQLVFHSLLAITSVIGTIFIGILNLMHFSETRMLFFCIVLFLFIVLISKLFTREQTPFQNLSATVLPIILFAFPMLAWAYISVEYNLYTYNGIATLMPIVMIWINDTFAYLGGKLYGKNKLFERISPNKTIEGFLTGLLFCIGGVFGYFYFFNKQMPDIGTNDTVYKIIYGAIVSFFGTTGDLVQSMWKRSVGIKDSGSILPGHGGFYDRFDALFFVLPFLYILQYILL